MDPPNDTKGWVLSYFLRIMETHKAQIQTLWTLRSGLRGPVFSRGTPHKWRVLTTRDYHTQRPTGWVLGHMSCDRGKRTAPSALDSPSTESAAAEALTTGVQQPSEPGSLDCSHSLTQPVTLVLIQPCSLTPQHLLK